MRKWVADWGRVSVEGRKSVCAEGWEVKGKDNPVASWCASSRT